MNVDLSENDGMRHEPKSANPGSDEEGNDESGRRPDFDDISLTELSAFTGESKYPKLWMPYLRGDTRFAGFNYWAAILGISWFFYRKLYAQGLAYLFVQFGLPFLVFLAFVFLFPEAVAIHGYVLGVGMAVALLAIGLWANLALCDKAVRTIRQVDDLNFNNDLQLETIAGAGGVNFPAFFIAFLVNGIFWRAISF